MPPTYCFKRSFIIISAHFLSSAFAWHDSPVSIFDLWWLSVSLHHCLLQRWESNEEVRSTLKDLFTRVWFLTPHRNTNSWKGPTEAQNTRGSVGLRFLFWEFDTCPKHKTCVKQNIKFILFWSHLLHISNLCLRKWPMLQNSGFKKAHELFHVCIGCTIGMVFCIL